MPSDSVAVVERRPTITKAQFDSLMDADREGCKAQKQTLPEGGHRRLQVDSQDRVLAFLVQRDELDAEGGKDLGVNVTDAQVQTRVDKVKKQYFGGNEKKYQQRLAGQGLTRDLTGSTCALAALEPRGSTTRSRRT